MKKKAPFPLYEIIMSEVVEIVGNAYDEDKITHYQAIGIFESAKQIFINIQNDRFEKKQG
jgi:hypothetical protein